MASFRTIFCRSLEESDIVALLLSLFFLDSPTTVLWTRGRGCRGRERTGLVVLVVVATALDKGFVRCCSRMDEQTGTVLGGEVYCSTFTRTQHTHTYRLFLPVVWS